MRFGAPDFSASRQAIFSLTTTTTTTITCHLQCRQQAPQQQQHQNTFVQRNRGADVINKCYYTVAMLK